MSIDYSLFAFPKPSNKKSNKKQKEEYCIMPPSKLYEVERKAGLERHEIFFGSGKRQLSINYGLIVFLKPEMHNKSNKGVHFDDKFNRKLKKIGEKAFKQKYPNLDFIKTFGKIEL